MAKITLQQLIDKDACKSQRKLFEKLFGESVEVTADLAIEMASEFDWNWAARNLLSGEGWKIYNEATAPAWKIHNKSAVLAWNNYLEAIDSALKIYDEAIVLARKIYDEAIAKSLKIFDENIDAAWKTYDESADKALKIYDESTALPRKIYFESVDSPRKIYDEAIVLARKIYDEAVALSFAEIYNIEKYIKNDFQEPVGVGSQVTRLALNDHCEVKAVLKDGERGKTYYWLLSEHPHLPPFTTTRDEFVIRK